MVPDRYVRASDLDGKLDQSNNPDWKTVATTDGSGAAQRLHRLPLGRKAPDQGLWNLESKERAAATSSSSFVGAGRTAPAARRGRRGLPLFGGIDTPNFPPTTRAAT